MLGHNAKTQEELEDMVMHGRWSQLIHEVPERKGDFIQINPGTVHAIKGALPFLKRSRTVILHTAYTIMIACRMESYESCIFRKAWM